MASLDDGGIATGSLTEREAYLVMTEFVWDYARRAGDDLLTLLAGIELDAEGRSSDPAAWYDWLDCVRYVKAGLPPRRETE